MNFMQQWKTRTGNLEKYAQNSQKSKGGSEQPIFENIENDFCQSETRIEVPTPDPANLTLADASKAQPQADRCLFCQFWINHLGLAWWSGKCSLHGHNVGTKSRCVEVLQ